MKFIGTKTTEHPIGNGRTMKRDFLIIGFDDRKEYVTAVEWCYNHVFMSWNISIIPNDIDRTISIQLGEDYED